MVLPSTYARLSLLRRCLRSAAGTALRHPQPLHTASPLRCETPRFHLESESKAYDGPGKTTVSVLNDEVELLMVNSYSTMGFRLNNDMKAYGPIAIMPTCVLGWEVDDVKDITEESLAFFLLLNPKPNIIIIGYVLVTKRR